MGMAEIEKLVEIYKQLEDAGLMVVAGKKETAELMVSHGVVPVVRSKDCKTYSNGTCWKMRGKMNPDGFCSYGERKDNG